MQLVTFHFYLLSIFSLVHRTLNGDLVVYLFSKLVTDETAVMSDQNEQYLF